jgi:hypothetical protein
MSTAVLPLQKPATVPRGTQTQVLVRAGIREVSAIPDSTAVGSSPTAAGRYRNIGQPPPGGELAPARLRDAYFLLLGHPALVPRAA